jgi:uroporphyrinogen-III synthase
MTDSGNEKTYAIFDTAANRKIIGDLNKAGAKLLFFPPLTTEKIQLNEAEAAQIGNLQNFDWLIFADVFAVDYTLEHLEEYDIDFYDLDDLRVCALGETVSDRLRFASVHADVIPANIQTREIFPTLLNYIGETEISGLRFLYLTDDSGRSDLSENLRTKNADVFELPVYRTILNESSGLIKLKTLLKGGAIDEFILTAPNDLIALRKYFGNENLPEILSEISISVSDGVMFQAVKEHELKRVGLFHPDKLVKVF